MRSIAAPSRADGGWWGYQGPFALVCTGLGVGDIVLPVRLPSAPSNQPHLEHHLADPQRWHKIDLIRRPDPQTTGGWRYEAHLLVLVGPYVSPAAKQARAAVPTGRRAGGDLNVSNFTVVSADSDGGDVRVSRVARDNGQRESEVRRRKKRRDRIKALERSRRNHNGDQYLLSGSQQREQQRRRKQGLPQKSYTPAGPRKAEADGKPTRAYRRDRLSHSYRVMRAKIAADEHAHSQRSKQAAQSAAKAIVAEHGCRIVIEDVNVSGWARRWGRGIHTFTPGRLQQALQAEIEACRGQVHRVCTWTTALSQHCVCGHRANKPLGQRVHDCSACGLKADRDTVAALLAAHTGLTDPDEPASAHVDWVGLRRTLHDPQTWDLLGHQLEQVLGQQDGPSASTHNGPRRTSSAAGVNGPPSCSDGSGRRTAGQASGATPLQPPHGATSVHSPERNPCMTRDGDANAPPSRDIS